MVSPLVGDEETGARLVGGAMAGPVGDEGPDAAAPPGPKIKM
jgi:hypothetical protein